jgi:MerR family transcriptional regulator, thiopeptide resistance regulator
MTCQTSRSDPGENLPDSSGRELQECGYEIHQGLAEMYVMDSRFTQTYEQIKPGMAQYLAAAIGANAARYGHQV